MKKLGQVVSKRVAIQILKIKDALIKGDDIEAYHQLYIIADPDCIKLTPWEEIERISRENDSD